MKKLIILMFIFLMPHQAYSNQTLTICYDSWPPSTIFPDTKNGQKGFVIDMISEIFTSQGYEIKFRLCPYARCISDCSIGKCDLIPEVVPDLNSIDGFINVDLKYPKEPSFTYKYTFFVHADSNWEYSGIQSLQSKIIADIVGYDYSSLDENLEAYLNDKNNSKNIYKTSGSDAVEKILLRISQKKIHIFCESELVGQYYIKKLGLEDKIKTAGSLNKMLVLKPAFSAKNPNSAKLMETWDNGIQKIKANNLHLNFIKKYIKSESITNETLAK